MEDFMEIERKFKVTSLPDNLEQYQKKEIMQGYLCTRPVVRIRKSNEKYILTYKNKGNLSQKNAIMSEEVEVDLTQEAFNHLLPKVDGNIIEKTRYLIPLDQGYTVELDVFKGKLEGLYFAEVEFPKEEDAIAFKKPDWLGEDISKDKRYRNSFLTTVAEIHELDIQ